MKKILALIVAVAVSAFSLQASGFAYHVTNDLGNIFSVFYWTNNAGTNVFSLQTNLAPTASTVFSVSTNGNAGLGLQPTNSTAAILTPWTNLPFGGGNLSALFVSAMNQIAPAVETVPQTQLALKSYFITGARPSQANYWELIDTWFWYVNSMWTNSQIIMSNSAATLVTMSPKAGATVTFTRLNGGYSVGYFQMSATNYNNIIPSTNTAYFQDGSGHWIVQMPLTFSNNISPLISPTVVWGKDAAFNNQVLQNANLGYTVDSTYHAGLNWAVSSNYITISFTGQNGSSSTPGYSDRLTFWIQ